MTSTQVKQGWQSKLLEEVLVFFNGKSIKAQEEGLYPVYGSNGIIGKCDEFKYEDVIVLGRVGAYCGSVNYEKNKLWASDNTIVVKAKKLETNRFFYYLLKNLNLNFYAGGAAQPLITQGIVKKIEVNVPSSSIQQKIASILSVFDDLIENNTKRIKLLESTAQLIYKEWFVDFKFPGHEKVKMVDSGTEFGEIPEGWEVKEIGKVFETVLGGTPARKNKNYWIGGLIPWINSGKVNDLRIIEESELITADALKKSATKMMPIRTTLVAITGATLGQVSLSEIECCANQSVVGIFDQNKIYNEFIYLKIREVIENIILHAGGGAQQHINKDIINKFTIIVPDKRIIGTFDMISMPFFNKIANLLFQNKKLRETRDLLLPKLVTGDVEVENLTII